jgi:hypothetical protein
MGLSSGLRMVSKVASSLEAVPLLAAYAAPVAWTADRLASIASYYGHSKPEIDGVALPVNSQKFRYGATSSGGDDSYLLTMRHDTKIKTILDMSARKEDEMSFNFLKGVESYYSTVTWNTAQPVSTSLLAYAMSPHSFHTNTTYSSAAKVAAVRTFPVFSYLAEHFQSWRGSIILRLRFIKTQYHTGRVLLVFQPSNTSLSTPSIADSTYCLREVVDLRYSDEVEVKLPFIIAQHFLGISDYAGRFSIRVLNQLRAPDSVSLNVPIVISVRAGEDFEVAVPCPGASFNTPMLIGNALLDDEAIGSANQEHQGLRPAEEAIGESFTSIRQLLNRNSQIFNVPTTVTTNVLVHPYAMGVVTTSAGTLSSGPCGDALSRFGTMYQFHRGSIRIAIQNTDTTDVPLIGELFGFAGSTIFSSSAYLDMTSGTVFPTFVGNAVPRLYALPIEKQNSGLTSWLVPYYNQLRCSLIQPAVSNAWTTKDVSEPDIWLGVSKLSLSTTNYYRSVGEDYQLGYFIGVLPVLYGFT